MDKDAAEFKRLYAIADSHARIALHKLIANYDVQGCKIGDPDLDDEQPINITFRGMLGDIRAARTALSCLNRIAEDGLISAITRHGVEQAVGDVDV